ncbi:hypothetical protein [Treponema sp.]|uniref:hypothetical protein n=1 Tax=Treponema sp. TaxID=166 RepID=UPI003890D409
MKKLFVILTAVCVFLFGSASFAKEPRVSKIETKDKSYVGHYDESMTPENSCVISFSLPELKNQRSGRLIQDAILMNRLLILILWKIRWELSSLNRANLVHAICLLT